MARIADVRGRAAAGERPERRGGAREGALQRLADAAPAPRLRALRALARTAAAVAQRESSYDGVLPAHDTYRDGFAMETLNDDEEKETKTVRDFTYHHIIPENRLKLVTKAFEEISDYLKENDDDSKEGFGAGVGALTEGARPLWAETRVTNFLFYVHKEFGDLGVALERKAVGDTIAAHGGDLFELLAAIRDLVKPQIQARTPYAPPLQNLKSLIEPEYANLNKAEPDLSALDPLLDPLYYDVAQVKAAAAAAIKECRGRSGHRGTYKGAYLAALKATVRPAGADYWFARKYPKIAESGGGAGTLRELVQKWAMPNPADKALEHAVQWNPGNVHRGPSSTLRESGGSAFDQLVNDGGNDFEKAAANIVSQEHYAALVAMNTEMEAFLGTHGKVKPTSPNYSAKIAAATALAQAMVRVQGFGLTGFKEEQWEQKGDGMRLRLNEAKIRAAGLGDALPQPVPGGGGLPQPAPGGGAPSKPKVEGTGAVLATTQ